jgi:hypothetical protein
MTGQRHRIPFLPLVTLLATSCSLKPPPPATVPQWTAVPAVVVQAMCIKLHTEGMSGAVNVVSSTEPLITRESLIGLGEVAEQQDSKKDPSQVAASLAAGAPKLPVVIEVPEGSCEFHAVASAKEARDDEMLLQLSSPLVNPYERESAGLFARLSLGGENPQWYWVPLAKTKEGKWLAGTPLSIAVPH